MNDTSSVVAESLSSIEVRAAWGRLTRSQRAAFLDLVGVRAAVHVFGLGRLDVALALRGPIERALERVREQAG
jgi:hypothetical protein